MTHSSIFLDKKENSIACKWYNFTHVSNLQNFHGNFWSKNSSPPPSPSLTNSPSPTSWVKSPETSKLTGTRHPLRPTFLTCDRLVSVSNLAYAYLQIGCIEALAGLTTYFYVMKVNGFPSSKIWFKEAYFVAGCGDLTIDGVGTFVSEISWKCHRDFTENSCFLDKNVGKFSWFSFCEKILSEKCNFL